MLQTSSLSCLARAMGGACSRRNSGASTSSTPSAQTKHLTRFAVDKDERLLSSGSKTGAADHEKDELAEHDGEPDCEPAPAPLVGVQRVVSKSLRRLSQARLSSFPSLSELFSKKEEPDWWTLADVPEVSSIHIAIEGIREYVASFEEVDLDPFWHRKSKQTVLACVVCRVGDGYKIYRGMNTEVSLPSGSLCAERAGIARAASDFQRAKDIATIAVCDPSNRINPLWPCEVCQSWLAKLRDEAKAINVIAVRSPACEEFAVQVNGKAKKKPLKRYNTNGVGEDFRAKVQLGDGESEWPWEAETLVYVDGGWSYLHKAQQHILKEAKTKGTHLLVGVHSDETLSQVFGEEDAFAGEEYELRLSRVAANRHVGSVLRGAPWQITAEMVDQLGISKVVTGSVGKARDLSPVAGRKALCDDPYAVVRGLDLLVVVPSLDDQTEDDVRCGLRSRADSGRKCS